MDDQPNPYESPRTESRLVEPPEPPQPHPSDGWKFILLGVTILCGFASFFPWLAAILAFISAPVFVRYFVLKRQSAGGVSPAPGTIVAGMTGAVGLGFGIVAASAGAFLGVCSTSTWTLGLGFMSIYQGENGYGALFAAFVCGMILGAVACLVTGTWLFQRIWHKQARDTNPNSRQGP
jgi:hypothetical protein